MTELNTQMSGESLDIAEQRKQELKQLFPGVFTEVKNDKGEIVEAIDFERLKAELGNFSELYEGRRERYGMEWPGKRDCLRLIQEPSRATLKPCREESVDFDNTENLFIEGDNLEVLKLLQKAYYGKIKMIYIDPPYNTGKEFIYPDNFSEPLENYLAYAGLSGEEGKKFSSNSANEGRFHTKWLNMMFPRLYLARNLLREDGVIFISIDDNEVENLRRICDEVFGEENFVSQNVWQKRYSRENRGIIGDAHEYVVVYAKNIQDFGKVSNLVSITESQKKAYKNTNDDPNGDWRAIPMTAQGFRPNQMYKIISPAGKIFTPPEGRCWSMIETEFEKLKKAGRIYFGKNGDSQPGVIRYLSEVEGVVPWTWWPHEETGHTDEAKKEIREYLGNSGLFDTPKPLRLINRILEIATCDEDIVLDFFAGSATTAHAVLERNVRDGGGRKFILVQLPEILGDDAVELSNGRFQNVADIGKGRLTNAIRNIKDQHSDCLDFANVGNADLGFKSFKLKSSNFKQWQVSNTEIADEDLKKQLELHIDPIDPNATQEDILYELLIKAGVMPTKKIELIELAGHAVFSVDEGGWLICLQDKVEQSLIDAVLEKEPVQFICLDRAFHGNDQLKANAVSTFANFNEGKDKADQIEFRTV